MELREAIQRGIVAWKKEDIVQVTDVMHVYKVDCDISDGHLAFVPLDDNRESVVKCLERAYRHGMELFKGNYEHFEVEMIMTKKSYPYVNLISKRV